MSKSIKSFVVISSVFALILSQSTALWGGITGKVSGRVVDGATGNPLAGANVMIVGTTLGAAADVEGYYFIINIPPGAYTVSASVIGYAAITKTDVLVRMDITTPVDFDMQTAVIAGAEVTVVAEREIIRMDVSGSIASAVGEEMIATPMVKDISDYIDLQAGIEGMVIRGGTMDQTTLMLDGLTLVDNRSNAPLMGMVNLSSVKSLEIIKGGFSAEYGNVRSGVINVVTKDADPDKYSGSVNIQYVPPRLKHSGNSLQNWDSYWLRAYMDPDVAFVGTKAKDEQGEYIWDKYTQQQNRSFDGWNKYSAKLLANDLAIDNKTPQECYDFYMWNHRAEGPDYSAVDLEPEGFTGRPRETLYGQKPDVMVDLGFGGPVPFIGKYLGNLAFFAAARTNNEMFATPISEDREYYTEDNVQLKLTSRLSPSFKIDVEAIYGDIESAATSSRGSSQDGYHKNPYNWTTSNTNLYSAGAMVKYNIYRSMIGLGIDHTLSPSTFYKLRITQTRVSNRALAPPSMRDTTTIRFFGNTPVDELPYGMVFSPADYKMIDGPTTQAAMAEPRDQSVMRNTTVKFDLISQVSRQHMLKAGFLFNYDDLRTLRGGARFYERQYNSWQNWRKYPYRFGAYIEDKFEFEGMIANIGLRADYNNANTEWYTVDPYSKYLSVRYRDVMELYTGEILERVFTAVTPTEPAESHLKISPRLGISYPISERSKIYFNYGHFYSMPRSNSMYRIQYGSAATSGISVLGNPSLLPEKTVAYDLGFESNVFDLFLVHISGYYKDVSEQRASVGYNNIDGSVNYTTYANNDYEDIRGFEVRVDKTFGRWIMGWASYDYKVITSGYVGRQENYEDPREQRLYGLRNPYQERPLARPVARGNLRLMTPVNWGPAFAGVTPLASWSLSLLYSYKAGSYDTWDPLGTYLLIDNIQWEDYHNIDARLEKQFSVGWTNVTFFADIQNLFDIKHFNTGAFAGGSDEEAYLESLHLPLYKDEEYSQYWVEKGDDMVDVDVTPDDVEYNDKPGEMRSDDKPYINDPNRDYMNFRDRRFITFGLMVAF